MSICLKIQVRNSLILRSEIHDQQTRIPSLTEGGSSNLLTALRKFDLISRFVRIAVVQPVLDEINSEFLFPGNQKKWKIQNTRWIGIYFLGSSDLKNILEDCPNWPYLSLQYSLEDPEKVHTGYIIKQIIEKVSRRIFQLIRDGLEISQMERSSEVTTAQILIGCPDEERVE